MLAFTVLNVMQLTSGRVVILQQPGSILCKAIIEFSELNETSVFLFSSVQQAYKASIREEIIIYTAKKHKDSDQLPNYKEINAT